MAGLSNTGIKGFIASAKFTGSTILKKGKEIPEMVEHFLSGFAGYGWKIWEHRKGRYKLEIDDLNVRGTMTVYELLIQKIRAVIGALAITQGQGKIKSVALSPDQSEYLIQVEEDMSFREYDFIRCQTWTGNVKMYHVKVDRIENNQTIHIPIEEFDTDYDEYGQLVIHNAPAIGDDIIQFGNEVYEERQSAIYLHADENGQPAIDIMFGINSKDWTNCVKGRMGGDIPGTDGAKGFYFENGMVKGTDETGHTVYCIYPNGDAMFGDESAMFNSDRSGQLAGGAIRWHFNDAKGRFELILGEDVILSWDNLDNTTKEMLTPKIGENGNWWIGGEDTGQKAEGEDGTSPYIGENGNWWFGTTDTGVQAKANDGKSPYIGTNGNWFVWDDTLNEFVDSGDTSVGDDGKSPEIRDGYWWTWDGTEYVNTGVKAKGEDANLLDWVNEWNNNRTLIGAEYIVSPKTFSGTRSTDGKLTGVAMGRDCIEIDGVKRTGIFALVNDDVKVSIDPINGEYKFNGEINATSGEIGSLDITETGDVVMFSDEESQDKLIFRKSKLPSIASIVSAINSNGTTGIGAGIATLTTSQVVSGSTNASDNGAVATFNGTNLELNARGQAQAGGMASYAEAILYARVNGVRRYKLATVRTWFTNASYTDESASITPLTYSLPVDAGLYTFELVIETVGSVISATSTSSSSTFSWAHTVAGIKRQQYGLDGLMFVYSGGHFYFNESGFLDGKAPADKWNAPGILAKGRISAAGVRDATKAWGAKNSNSPVTKPSGTGSYRVPVSCPNADYDVNISPRTSNRMFYVGATTATYFEVYFQDRSGASQDSDFSYTLVGNNY